MSCLWLVGEEFECDITNVAHGGVFVARHEGRVIFVTDAIPGERVRVRVADTRHERFWRADTVDVLTPSSHRRPHVWAEADISRAPEDRAGGAEFGHIELGHQRELKAIVLRESFERVGRMNSAESLGHPLEVEPVGDDDQRDGLRWRTRARLSVDEQGRAGPRAARSHRVIPVTSLPLAVEGIESAARLDDNHGGLQSLSLVAPSDGEAFVVTDPHAPIIEHVDERAFRLRAGGFWQVHRDAPATLSNAVREALLDDVVDPTAPNLDLYGGVGLFAATLASLAGPTARVTSVESDDLAAEDAAENLSEWVGARALCASVEGFLRSEAVGSTSRHLDRYRRASVVLDPPRAGAGRGVIDTLATLHPAQIIYVACDPVALARDAAFLRDYDYRFEWARAFDMFPHTHHVEVVARFVPDGQ